MPTNLEFKVKIKSIDQFASKLEKIGAEFIAVLNQRDVYYKTKEKLLKLRIENGSESLILYKRNETGKNRWSDFKIIRFESTGVENFLNNIFDKQAVVTKKRLLYKYDNTRIHLDKVRRLGSFLELETLVLNDKSEAVKRFNKLILLLGLNRKEEIRKSYLNLITSVKR